MWDSAAAGKVCLQHPMSVHQYIGNQTFKTIWVVHFMNVAVERNMRSVRFWDFLLEWGGACLGRAQLDICKSNRRHRRKLQECTNSPLLLHRLLILICRQSLLHHSNSLWGVDENPIWPRSNCGRLTPCKELINSHNSLGREPVCSDTPSLHYTHGHY